MSSCQLIAPLGAIPTENASWYAVHTRSRHEKRVAAELERKGIKTFLPLYRDVRQWLADRMTVEVPLFSCYTFVNIDVSAQTRGEVLRTVGVLSFGHAQHQGRSRAD